MPDEKFVLETNVCRSCDLAMQLVQGVGWVHLPVVTGQSWWAVTDVECDTPDPRLDRCQVCPATVGVRPDGRLNLHTDPRTRGRGLPQPCMGSGLPGLPPRCEHEAFRESPRDP